MLNTFRVIFVDHGGVIINPDPEGCDYTQTGDNVYYSFDWGQPAERTSYNELGIGIAGEYAFDARTQNDFNRKYARTDAVAEEVVPPAIAGASGELINDIFQPNGASPVVISRDSPIDTRNLRTPSYLFTEYGDVRELPDTNTDIVDYSSNPFVVSAGYDMEIKPDPTSPSQDNEIDVSTETDYPQWIYIGVVGAGGPAGAYLQCSGTSEGLSNDTGFGVNTCFDTPVGEGNIFMCETYNYNENGENLGGLIVDSFTLDYQGPADGDVGALGYKGCRTSGEDGKKGGVFLRVCSGSELSDDGGRKTIVVRTKSLGKGGVETFNSSKRENIDEQVINRAKTTFPTRADRVTEVEVYIDNNNDGTLSGADLLMTIKADGGRAGAMIQTTNPFVQNCSDAAALICTDCVFFSEKAGDTPGGVPDDVVEQGKICSSNLFFQPDGTGNIYDEVKYAFAPATVLRDEIDDDILAPDSDFPAPRFEVIEGPAFDNTQYEYIAEDIEGFVANCDEWHSSRDLCVDGAPGTRNWSYFGNGVVQGGYQDQSDPEPNNPDDVFTPSTSPRVFFPPWFNNDPNNIIPTQEGILGQLLSGHIQYKYSPGLPGADQPIVIDEPLFGDMRVFPSQFDAHGIRTIADWYNKSGRVQKTVDTERIELIVEGDFETIVNTETSNPLTRAILTYTVRESSQAPEEAIPLNDYVFNGNTLYTLNQNDSPVPMRIGYKDDLGYGGFGPSNSPRPLPRPNFIIRYYLDDVEVSGRDYHGTRRDAGSSTRRGIEQFLDAESRRIEIDTAMFTEGIGVQFPITVDLLPELGDLGSPDESNFPGQGVSPIIPAVYTPVRTSSTVDNIVQPGLGAFFCGTMAANDIAPGVDNFTEGIGGNGGAVYVGMGEKFNTAALELPAPSPANFIPILLPGTGFTEATEELPPVTRTQLRSSSADTRGEDAKAIARFTKLPFLTRRKDFYISISAEHMMDIDYVEFSLDGGPWEKVTDKKEHPSDGSEALSVGTEPSAYQDREDGYREYLAKVDISDLGSGTGSTPEDGLHEIRARIVPTIGIPRVLQGNPFTQYNHFVTDTSYDCAVCTVPEDTAIGTLWNTKAECDALGGVWDADNSVSRGGEIRDRVADGNNSFFFRVDNEAKTVYVSNSGNDVTGDGTESLPYQTIRGALDREKNDILGGIIKLKPGSYTESINISAQDGFDFAHERPIVIEGESQDTVVWRPSRTANNTLGELLKGGDFVTFAIKNMTIPRGIPITSIKPLCMIQYGVNSSDGSPNFVPENNQNLAQGMTDIFHLNERPSTKFPEEIIANVNYKEDAGSWQFTVSGHGTRLLNGAKFRRNNLTGGTRGSNCMSILMDCYLATDTGDPAFSGFYTRDVVDKDGDPTGEIVEIPFPKKGDVFTEVSVWHKGLSRTVDLSKTGRTVTCGGSYLQGYPFGDGNKWRVGPVQRIGVDDELAAGLYSWNNFYDGGGKGPGQCCLGKHDRFSLQYWDCYSQNPGAIFNIGVDKHETTLDYSGIHGDVFQFFGCKGTPIGRTFENEDPDDPENNLLLCNDEDAMIGSQENRMFCDITYTNGNGQLCNMAGPNDEATDYVGPLKLKKYKTIFKDFAFCRWIVDNTTAQQSANHAIDQFDHYVMKDIIFRNSGFSLQPVDTHGEKLGKGPIRPFQPHTVNRDGTWTMTYPNSPGFFDPSWNPFKNLCLQNIIVDQIKRPRWKSNDIDSECQCNDGRNSGVEPSTSSPIVQPTTSAINGFVLDPEGLNGFDPSETCEGGGWYPAKNARIENLYETRENNPNGNLTLFEYKRPSLRASYNGLIGEPVPPGDIYCETVGQSMDDLIRGASEEYGFTSQEILDNPDIGATPEVGTLSSKFGPDVARTYSFTNGVAHNLFYSNQSDAATNVGAWNQYWSYRAWCENSEGVFELSENERCRNRFYYKPEQLDLRNRNFDGTPLLPNWPYGNSEGWDGPGVPSP